MENKDKNLSTETALDKARQAPQKLRPENMLHPKAQKQLKNMPHSYRNLYWDVMTGTNNKSPRNAIKAMCQQCIGYENTSESIKDCKGVTCPLYLYRPYQ